MGGYMSPAGVLALVFFFLVLFFGSRLKRADADRLLLLTQTTDQVQTYRREAERTRESHFRIADKLSNTARDRNKWKKFSLALIASDDPDFESTVQVGRYRFHMDWEKVGTPVLVEARDEPNKDDDEPNK